MYFDYRFFFRCVAAISIVALLLLFLTGCGTTQAGMTPDTGYLMISKGKAGMLGAVGAGAGADYCKVTKHNLDGIQFQGQLIYDDQGCRIDVVGGKQ
jgi:hypothetical protein